MRIVLALVLAAAVAVAVAAPAPAQDPPIRVGFASAMSGPSAITGEGVRWAGMMGQRRPRPLRRRSRRMRTR